MSEGFSVSWMVRVNLKIMNINTMYLCVLAIDPFCSPRKYLYQGVINMGVSLEVM